MSSRWVTSVRRRAAAFLAALALSALALPPARADEAARVRFVRGGIVLPLAGGEPAPPGETLRATLDGAAVPVLRLPGGRGWLIEADWTPRAPVRLAWEDGSVRTQFPLRAPLVPEPFVLRRLDWPPAGLLGARDTVTALAFDAGGAHLAAGTQGGRVAVFSLARDTPLWEVRRPGRVVKQLAFAPAGGRLYVGEQGPEGRLAAYDWRSGAGTPAWTFDTAAELGTTEPADPDDPYAWVVWPGAYRLAAVGGDVIAAYSHSWPEPGGRRALARLYRLDGATGEVRWAWPAKGPAPRVLTWFALAAQGGRIAVPVQLPVGATPAGDGSGASRVAVLDAATGRTAFRRDIPAVPPYRIAGLWHGVGLHPDGRRLAVSTEDGRGFLFAAGADGWREVAALTLVEPMRLGGVTVTAANGTLAATAGAVLFATGPSYAPLAYGEEAAGAVDAHPHGNTLFAYGWDGTRQWLWKLDNGLQGLAADARGHTLAVLQGGTGPQPAGAFNGVAVLDPTRSGEGRERLRYRYPLQGSAVYQGVAVSPDGGWIAVAEAPRQVRGDPRPQGRARVTILR